MTWVIIVDLLVDLGTIGRLARDRENGFVLPIVIYLPGQLLVWDLKCSQPTEPLGCCISIQWWF